MANVNKQDNSDIRRRNITNSLDISGYVPVPDNDEDDHLNKPAAEKKFASPYSAQNFGWIVAAVIVFYYFDFINIVANDTNINRTWLNIGFLSIGLTVMIALFLICYLYFYKRVDTDDWEKHYPAAIPTATATSVIGTLCVMIGLWPAWGLLTPVFLFVMFMGVIIIIAMLPNF